MLCSQMSGDRLGLGRFVVAGQIESDGEGLDRLTGLGLHQGGDAKAVIPKLPEITSPGCCHAETMCL